jgi:hypothetical protein
LLLLPASALALIFGSPDSEPTEISPPNFPYWENITQHRFGGPSVIYLGAGWIMTARHVGFGEVDLVGKSYVPTFLSRHPLLNANGSAADAVVFKINGEVELPALPILPLASTPPKPGEEILVIGFGRERKKVIEWRENGDRHFGFEWSDAGAKRWGTNRIHATGALLPQDDWLTHAFSFEFGEPGAEATTRYEAQAASGDSGGAVFVERNGEWKLAGMMISVSASFATPTPATHYGDLTYAADVTAYRSEILRWARPRCFNEEDDDGDGMVDFPADPGCASAIDTDEREGRFSRYLFLRSGPGSAIALLGIVGVGSFCAAWFLSRRRRESA